MPQTAKKKNKCIHGLKLNTQTSLLKSQESSCKINPEHDNLKPFTTTKIHSF